MHGDAMQCVDNKDHGRRPHKQELHGEEPDLWDGCEFCEAELSATWIVGVAFELALFIIVDSITNTGHYNQPEHEYEENPYFADEGRIVGYLLQELLINMPAHRSVTIKPKNLNQENKFK